MNADDEKYLRMTKEIMVKFIELGRVSPTNFDAHFRSIFWTIKNTGVSAQLPEMPDMSAPSSPSEPSED